MDKFVKDVVASVLGNPKANPSPLSRPNYQRQRAQQRLIVTNVTPTRVQPTPMPAASSTHTATEHTAAVRRASMAALIPSATIDKKAGAACSGCSCSSSSTTLRKMVTPPRQLGEVLGIRYCEGDSIITASTRCADITSLIATDDVLIHQGVQPDAIAYGALNDRTWTLSFSAPSTLADALESQISALWQHGSSCGKAVVASTPSARLLHQLGIHRQGAIAALNGKTAADVALALSEYLKMPHRTTIHLLHHTAILQGSEPEVSAGIEALSAIMSRQ